MASPNTLLQGKEEAYEEKNVHEVYQQIAKHFSSTRYKVRPICVANLPIVPVWPICYYLVFLELFNTNKIASHGQ